jgi:predicted DNA-binding protein (MmcQ/YjbR family)
VCNKSTSPFEVDGLQSSKAMHTAEYWNKAHWYICMVTDAHPVCTENLQQVLWDLWGAIKTTLDVDI